MSAISIRRIRGLIASALMTAILTGCATIGPGGLIESRAPSELSAPAASAIAGDLVTRLAEQVGPGTVTIVLKPDGTPFGSALETSLRTWGYAVTTEQSTNDKKAVSLAYVVAPFDNQILARLSTATVEIGRVYSPTSTGATPVSPLSVMRRG